MKINKISAYVNSTDLLKVIKSLKKEMATVKRSECFAGGYQEEIQFDKERFFHLIIQSDKVTVVASDGHTKSITNHKRAYRKLSGTSGTITLTIPLHSFHRSKKYPGLLDICERDEIIELSADRENEKLVVIDKCGYSNLSVIGGFEHQDDPSIKDNDMQESTVDEMIHKIFVEGTMEQKTDLLERMEALAETDDQKHTINFMKVYFTNPEATKLVNDYVWDNIS